ncbi:hypothetical protein COW36_01075 [bacterium (Candidatus Blackallbacteria) CG17_big_fil_post_rev_8_21_14_2_50_48_46]|uniref:MerC domain-containing protein n=1 Tax=bacterium (Candidatus Blackallbacteria) CG17_big_fil_post_rev_8_21_14_2_50_48_46 TaxID=2014261 RepID=A0A2M7GBE5_9BACT|nr:MAG: hypothetical protein COW64_10100 [bacterium (Candidatus Blackallbacteria) CG18_big_fil_WC_8_21_14_2_50_49_26]PIW19460.1 MAG: hypothetical protein COW36_01075 [bacterium (Candidatus Blackallbacteria) CG17_big_fil_post_rev_8_21_14_2_50_48_46]PIW48936.1 MAG: hypothetical protein COW20_07380 [bacterium (Candidatus Blackallbacteria) CG13_big_fil_rev_8_21_14_2_50_49_14]
MILSDRPLKYLDQLGATLSLACAVHCALQPLLLIALPLMGLGFLMDETLETVFLAVTLSMAGWAFFSGFNHHRKGSVFVFWGLAALLIGASRVQFLESYEMLLAVSGALALMSGHLLNQHLHRQYHLQIAPIRATIAKQLGTGLLKTEKISHSCQH